MCVRLSEAWPVELIPTLSPNNRIESVPARPNEEKV